MTFVHLHNHSDRSMLDGLQSPQSMVARAAELGMPAIGLTDHGNLHAAYAFHAAAMNHGVTPVIGIEAYVAPDSRLTKTSVLWGEGEQRGSRDDVSAKGKYTHLSLWATSETGLRNLYALTSDSYLQGKYGKYARMDWETIAAHSAGLVASTGCPGGEVQTRLRLGQHAEADAAAARLADIMGPGRLFCEIMDHGITVEKRVRDDLLALARRHRLPLLATNDTHYARAEDADTHDALLCVGVQKKLADSDRFRFDGREYYLKTSQQMRALFSGADGACDNTLAVAAMHEGYGDLFERRDLMPRFPCPDGFDEATLLDRLAREGLNRKGHGHDRQYLDRLEYELGVIQNMGFPGYFLIVGEAVAWAKANGLEVGPGRGSAAASLVCWVLDITAIDPLEDDLVFERFLNPERVSMPDIDLDFDEKDRVVQHLADKYGADKVARISTTMEVKSRNALKDAARVTGAGFMAGNMLAGALPPDLFGAPAPLAALTDENAPRHEEMHKLRRLAAQPEYAPIVDLATRLEGTVRGVGIHAGGVVVSRRPLELDIPLAVQSGKVVTQYDMNEVESLGALKIDALGLSTLGTLKRALAATGVDRDTVPRDDPKAWALLASGHTTGVFQLESPGMQKALRQIKPTCREDLAAVIALYRPGPMHSIDEYAARKHGQHPTEPIHPELEDELTSLADTYHLLVFQEQVMQAARDVCGYSLGEADLLRRAMGKKDAEKMAQQRVMFFERGLGRGHSEEALEALWSKLVPFAAYGFNKPHAVAYASVGYLAAYLKAHYPAQYMAANLATVHAKTDADEDKDKYLLSLAEVRRMGIKLLPPSIREPFSGFRAEEGGIRYGLDVIKGVGSAVVDDVRAGLPYTDLLDYMLRAGKGKNGAALKSLAKAGALDELGTRKGILEAAPQLAKRIPQVRKYKTKSNALTWENLAVDMSDEEYDVEQRLALEKEVLGAYVSAHPLDRYRGEIAASRATPIGQVDDAPADTRMILIGTVATVDEKVTKTGKPYGAVKISDDTGDARFNIWSSSRDGAISWSEARTHLEKGAVIKAAVVRVDNERFSGLEIKNLRRLDTRRERANGSLLADYMLWWAAHKIPVVAQDGRDPSLSGGILEATCDPTVIRHMAAHPRATAYGIRCGRSTGILGIDLDVKGGIDGPQNFDSLLGSAHLPETMKTITPSGGMHLLLRVPSSAWEWLRSIQRSDLGIDLRCEGITGPGSRNEAGVYEPADDVRVIADAGDDVLAVLRDLVSSSPAARDVDYAADVDEERMRAEAIAALGGIDDTEIAAAQRTIARLIAGQLAEIARFTGMPEGSGLDGQLFRSAVALGHYVPLYLSWERAHDLLLDAALAAREDGGRGAFSRTVTRGLKTGAAKPDRIRRLDRAPELITTPTPPPQEAVAPGPGGELPDLVCPAGVYNPARVISRILERQAAKLAAATCLRDVTGCAWYMAKSLRAFGVTPGEILEYVLAKSPAPRDEPTITALKSSILEGWASPQDYAATA